jgi:hypothetical protein
VAFVIDTLTFDEVPWTLEHFEQLAEGDRVSVGVERIASATMSPWFSALSTFVIIGTGR